MATSFVTVSVSELPYPEGLGKNGYNELRSAMARLLGADHWTQEAHERAFWEPRYQDVLRAYLAPKFLPGNLVSIAQEAARIACQSGVLGRAFECSAFEAREQYRAAMMTLPSFDFWDGTARNINEWVCRPPRLYRRGAAFVIVDGRHRLSMLRSLVEPRDPGFPVLVELDVDD